MEKQRKVKWDQQALINLEKSLEWISQDSIQHAEKIEKAILEKIDAIIENPERFPPDKYKNNNTGNYRAFEAFSHRISYQFNEKEIRILHVRHVKQRPIKY